MPALKAEGELTALGLLVITKAAQDPAQPVQVVLACDPKPGTQLARGAIVKIDVNQAVANAAQQAAAGIEVPACEGRDGREVVRELTRLGLTPKVSTEASRLQPAGYVLRTYPAAGERLSVGGELVLMLAR
jgi:beta-lactam-binding protein with PASTA domain